MRCRPHRRLRCPGPPNVLSTAGPFPAGTSAVQPDAACAGQTRAAETVRLSPAEGGEPVFSWCAETSSFTPALISSHRPARELPCILLKDERASQGDGQTPARPPITQDRHSPSPLYQDRTRKGEQEHVGTPYTAADTRPVQGTILWVL